MKYENAALRAIRNDYERIFYIFDQPYLYNYVKLGEADITTTFTLFEKSYDKLTLKDG